jgi:hypothetical protein
VPWLGISHRTTQACTKVQKVPAQVNIVTGVTGCVIEQCCSSDVPEGDTPASDSDSDSEDEESNWLATALDSPVQSVHFDFDIDIDINSHTLRDMVATAPIIEEVVAPVRAPAVKASVQDSDWHTRLDSW